jgi:hypothetical protein
MPLNFESPLLHCYWISLTWPKWEGPGIVVGLDQPVGLGVTAYTVDDAVKLLAELDAERYLREAEKVEWIEITDLEQLDRKRFKNHVLANSGPQYFRGVWMGGLNVGFGASGQRPPTVDPQP